jgi:hypothetical protein
MIFFLNVGVILNNVGAILINVGAILTGVNLQWGDLARYLTYARPNHYVKTTRLLILYSDLDVYSKHMY